MPTYITYLVDDLDAELKKQNPLLNNFTDFTARRTRSYLQVLADYQEELAQNDDPFVKADNYSSPITTGTEKINTTVGDIYRIALPADVLRVAGNAILVAKGTTAIFDSVPRMSWDTIIASGGSQTPFAFWEENGYLVIYDKDGNFDNTAAVSFPYYRRLDATVTPTTTALDIKPNGFSSIVSSVLSLMKD
jgi:hypothetical protein